MHDRYIYAYHLKDGEVIEGAYASDTEDTLTLAVLIEDSMATKRTVTKDQIVRTGIVGWKPVSDG